MVADVNNGSVTWWLPHVRAVDAAEPVLVQRATARRRRRLVAADLAHPQPSLARCGGAGWWQPDRERFRRWLTCDVARRCNGQPVAAAPAGAMWSRRSAPPVLRRTCASCCSPAICPSRGDRRRTCWSGANGCGSTPRSSISAGCGSSGATPSCSNRASPSGRRRRSARRPPAPGAQRRDHPDIGRSATGAGRLRDARGHCQTSEASRDRRYRLRGDCPS